VIKKIFSNIIISLVLCFFLFPTNSFAGVANLAWDPSANPTDVTGYMIHYGTASDTLSMGIDVGNTTSYSVCNLIDGQTYYFVVTAYNAAGVESTLSNEVSMKSTVTDTTTTTGTTTTTAGTGTPTTTTTGITTTTSGGSERQGNINSKKKVVALLTIPGVFGLLWKRRRPLVNLIYKSWLNT
jgi:fibronectin type 3 domain-containing protein